jgi:hypothetical protein
MKQHLFTILLLACTFSAINAQDNTRANTIFTGTAQPFVTNIAPLGAQRGSTVTMTIDGANLTGANEVLWNKPGVTSKITFNAETAREMPKLAEGQTGQLVIDKLVRNKLTIETTITADAAPGIYNYRIKTPMGTTNLGSFVVTSLPDVAEKEMNDSPVDAQEIKLPASIGGAIGKAGDSDYFKFTAAKNQTLVFQMLAAAFGSRLDSVLTLMDANSKTLASNDSGNGGADSLLGYTFFEAGEYVIRITEFEKQKPVLNGMGYRLQISEAPYIASVFPMGLQQGTTVEVKAAGFNLGNEHTFKITAKPQAAWGDFLWFQPTLKKGLAIAPLRIPVGRDPEVMETHEAHNSLATAQTLTIPSTVNGNIQNLKTKSSESDFYKFAAKKGQTIVFAVAAQRFGSSLDSVIEIFDQNGQLVPRATVRCELQTNITLRDHNSNGSGIRIESWNGMQPGDYVMTGNEILMIDRLPKGPDEDTFFVADPLTGDRIGMLETTPESHAINSPVYKVSVHPPGTKFSSNGLPTVTLYYRNDDGPAMFGKDSRLTFTAPADGEYVLKLSDVRGLHGYNFGYRLSAHEPRPDFSLVADLLNPNVPLGAARPITVTANRIDGFNGDIEIKLLDLPVGWTATPGTIKAGQHSTVLILAASEKAVGGFPLKLQGSAMIGRQRITRHVDTHEKLSLVSTAPAPELTVFTDVQRLTVEPGGTVSMTASIKRHKGFSGRVPIDVRGLPHGIITTDVGLNGILIQPEETAMRFTIEVQPWVKPGEQPFYVVARIETTSPQRQDFAYAVPIMLTIKAKANTASVGRK